MDDWHFVFFFDAGSTGGFPGKPSAQASLDFTVSQRHGGVFRKTPKHKPTAVWLLWSSPCDHFMVTRAILVVVSV